MTDNTPRIIGTVCVTCRQSIALCNFNVALWIYVQKIPLGYCRGHQRTLASSEFLRTDTGAGMPR